MHIYYSFALSHYQEEYKRNLLSSSNTNWILNPQKGLTKTKVTLNDFGSYKCVGTFQNVTSGAKFFKIRVEGITWKDSNILYLNMILNNNLSKGVELSRNDSADAGDPIKGGNVTLQCRAFMFSKPPKWFYYQVDDTRDQIGEKVWIDQTNPPEGTSRQWPR